MKISASDVRVGNLIDHQGKLWRVLKKEHVKPGKGGAFVQLELKEILLLPPIYQFSFRKCLQYGSLVSGKI